MDSMMSIAGLPTAQQASKNSFNFHSTDPIISTLSTLAHDSLQDHISDYADAHRWIDSFFEKLDLKGTSGRGGSVSRPAMSELMKTPGRKRVVGTNSTNHSTPSLQTAAKKDPLATLLFPTGPSLDKENNLSPPSRTSTPKRLLSPVSNNKKSSGIPLSPMRTGSPRPVPSTSRTQEQSRQPTAAPLRAPTPAASPAPVIARDFAQPQPAKTLSQLQEEIEHEERGDLSNVLEEDEEEELEEEEEKQEKQEIKLIETEISVVATEEGRAELSMIGEEEEEEEAEEEVDTGKKQEEEEKQATQSLDEKKLPQLVETASFVVPETQVSTSGVASPLSRTKTAMIPDSLPVPVLSPQSRSVSGTSSVAPDADDDESVPLNDGPSSLRSTVFEGSLSSSLPASSTTRTPGGSSSRFAAVGSYSAAKIGMGNINIGSSPPQASSSTFSGPSHNFRISSGGTQQLNFVGLPKKSMGLQLGRNWSTSNNSNASDSQGSTSQGRQSFATAATSSSLVDTSSSANGAIKRKSLSGHDVSNKVAKVARGSEIGGGGGGEQPLSKIEQIRGRLQNLNARNSVAAGSHIRMSTAGGFNSTLFPTTASKPLSGSASTNFANQSSKSTLPPSTSTATITNSSTTTVELNTATVSSAGAGAGVVRRPSVMERVKSFEYTAVTTQDHLNPPSPSKIPSAFTRPVSPSPLHSPRGLASPTFGGPSSPRPITRSATSGLPLSTFGSPKMATSSSFSPMIGSPKPIPSAFFRSPPVPSLAPAVPATSAFRAPPAPIPAPANLPLAAASPPRPNPLVRSTTPPGSPPALNNFTSIFQRFTAQREQTAPPAAVPVVEKKTKKESIVVISDDEDDYGREDDEEEDVEEEEEEEQPSIRPVKSSTSSIEQERIERAEAKAIAQRAREIEEQEAEREREEEASKKRLPSLPKPQLLTKDDESEEDDDEDMGDDEEEEEEEQVVNKKPVKTVVNKKPVKTVVKKATKEDLRTRTSPSKIVMPGTFGQALVAASSNQNSPQESEIEDNEDDADDEDRTTASTTGTYNFAHPQQGAFRPTKPSNLQKQRSTSSLASSVSSTTVLSLNQSVGNGATKKSAAAAKPKQAQAQAAALKKEKDEAERKKAMRDLQERRLAAQKKKEEKEQKKQEEERRAKAQELERKRKEREEAVAKAKASAARLAAKREAEEENSKKRKMEQENKVPLKKAATQSSRPMTASSSSHRISSLATSQARPVPTVSSNPLAKSGGASSMVGQKFMSNQIRLPDSSANARTAPVGPSTTIPKPFGLSASQGANRPPVAPQGSALRQPPPPPSAHKPDPEPYQELPEIDSEYSDSDDEAHEKKVASFPRWAQSPVLTHQLLEQQKINPDDIFGPIPALSVADMFRNSQSTARLRVRTSSAQWDGTDALTRTDMERYHKAMGFTKTVATTTGTSASGARDSEASSRQHQ